MTRFLAMKLLNMAILGRAEQHYTADNFDIEIPFQPEPNFPGDSLDSDSLESKRVAFPDIFGPPPDWSQPGKVFNSVYLVMDRRMKASFSGDVNNQVGDVNLRLQTIDDCALECKRTDDCNFFSAMVKSFGDENGDELDTDDGPNCSLFSSMYYDPMPADRRRWTSGQMPPKNAAWALTFDIENWTNDYPVRRDDLTNNYPKFVYLPNFMSAWSWGVHKQLVQGECSLDVVIIGDKEIGECFDECLKRPIECNAISHGWNKEKHEFECSLFYMHTYDEGVPRFEDYNRAAKNSKHDRKCWQQEEYDRSIPSHYNTWRVVPRSGDFPMYKSHTGDSGPFVEHRPDIVPWHDDRLDVVSATKRLLHGDSSLSQDATTFESCGKLCVEKWEDSVGCRAFSFNNREKKCELSSSKDVDSDDHSGNWISVKFLYENVYTTTTTTDPTATTTTTTKNEMRNFGKNCLEDGIIWNGQCSGDYQTGWNDNALNADVDAANQLLGCRQEAWTNVKALCLRHGSVCPKECAGYDENLGAFINFSYEDWMELGREDGMVYPED